MDLANKYYSYYTKTNVNVNMIIQTGQLFVGPLPRVRPRNGILALLVVSLRSEFIGEL